jgi:hypothetical protein
MAPRNNPSAPRPTAPASAPAAPATPATTPAAPASAATPASAPPIGATPETPAAPETTPAAPVSQAGTSDVVAIPAALLAELLAKVTALSERPAAPSAPAVRETGARQWAGLSDVPERMQAFGRWIADVYPELALPVGQNGRTTPEIELLVCVASKAYKHFQGSAYNTRIADLARIARPASCAPAAPETTPDDSAPSAPVSQA